MSLRSIRIAANDRIMFFLELTSIPMGIIKFYLFFIFSIFYFIIFIFGDTLYSSHCCHGGQRLGGMWDGNRNGV
jgi:hypothetical protein